MQAFPQRRIDNNERRAGPHHETLFYKRVPLVFDVFSKEQAFCEPSESAFRLFGTIQLVSKEIISENIVSFHHTFTFLVFRYFQLENNFFVPMRPLSFSRHHDFFEFFHKVSLWFFSGFILIKTFQAQKILTSDVYWR